MKELLRAIRYGHTARRMHGGVLDVNLLRRAGKKRKKQAPAGHDAVFRAHRADGAFGHATGTLHHVRQVQAGHRCDVNLPRLPGCYVCLPLCLRCANACACASYLQLGPHTCVVHDPYV